MTHRTRIKVCGLRREADVAVRLRRPTQPDLIQRNQGADRFIGRARRIASFNRTIKKRSRNIQLQLRVVFGFVRSGQVIGVECGARGHGQDATGLGIQGYYRSHLVGKQFLGQLLQLGARTYGVGPALRLPVFDAGRLRANLRGKRAEWDAAVHSYNATVFDAVRDVTDQLAVLASAQAQRAEQQHALQTATELLRLAHERRAAGLTSELPVLAAQLQQLNQQRLDTELDARVRDAQIALVRALGTLTPEAP